MEKEKPKLVVLSGAGMSADSGINTFRDSDGLWEGHDIQEVATPEGFHRNPGLVLKFYNDRRQNIREAEPNAGHKALVALEEAYQVSIVTQNIDDLHERAGSSHVIHLHGEIFKAQSSENPYLVSDLGDRDIHIGDIAEDGAQLRPHVVWFGEPVPKIMEAAAEVADADIVLIIGTSMVVYPAAGLIDYAPSDTEVYVVNPDVSAMAQQSRGVHTIAKRAAEGVPELVHQLLQKAER
jgi:NAD-dependent deacetylase